MDRRSFFFALAGTLAAGSVLTTTEAEARPATGPTLDSVRASLSPEGGPLEMQRGQRGGGRGWHGGGRGGWHGGGRGRWHGGGPRWRGGGWGPRPWGPRPWRRCWINRWGERVCRPPVYW